MRGTAWGKRASRLADKKPTPGLNTWVEWEGLQNPVVYRLVGLYRCHVTHVSFIESVVTSERQNRDPSLQHTYLAASAHTSRYRRMGRASSKN
jgi:hypothetical protein